MKTLVIYYTRTGNAKFMAETIAGELGADIEEVIDLKNRQGKLAFLPAGRDAMRGKETEIAQTKRTPTDYDLIIMGQPIWAGSPTPAIRTYLNKNDLSGKKVALFFSDTNLRSSRREDQSVDAELHLRWRASLAESVGEQGRDEKENR